MDHRSYCLIAQCWRRVLLTLTIMYLIEAIEGCSIVGSPQFSILLQRPRWLRREGKKEDGSAPLRVVCGRV